MWQHNDVRDVQCGEGMLDCSPTYLTTLNFTLCCHITTTDFKEF